MKTDNRLTLRHIAAVYLDTYASPRDLARPLSPEQVKDAGVLFLDLLAANEAELLVEQERKAKLADSEPSYHDIAAMFVARYKREKGIAGSLTDDDWYAATDVFLSYVSSIS